MTITDTMFQAIADAEAAARSAHDAGTCQDSEWSCSFCEVAR